MSEAYIGEIKIFGGNFAPRDWQFCDGALLPISLYQALFSLLGTTFGGDGQTTFAVPDLRGRIPLHRGQAPDLSNYVQGQKGGTETVTLAANQIGAHAHTLGASSANATTSSPANAVWAVSSANIYGTSGPYQPMNASTVSFAGGSQPHENLQPILGVNFIIALDGIYPTQS